MDSIIKVHHGLIVCAVRSPRMLDKVGSTSNSITYPRSKAAFTLVSFVTGYFYGLACFPLVQKLLMIISANPPDGSRSVPPPFSAFGFADSNFLTDRRLSLGYGLFNRWKRLHTAEVWRILRGD